MIGIIKKKIKCWLLRLNGERFCSVFNFANRNYYKLPFMVSWDDATNLYLVTDIHDRDQQVYIGRQLRIFIYAIGVRKRIERLGNKYFLDKIEFDEDDIVIDCGANVGELGLHLSNMGEKVRYVGFEPSALEAQCCELNNALMKDVEIINKGLWHSATTISFFQKNDTGDSSVFEVEDHEGTVTIQTTTLDAFVKDRNISKIKFFKLEAEGAEPEILDGAEESLSKIEWIAADCGPERGLNNETTAVYVINKLTSNGFSLWLIDAERLTLLFKNNNIVKSAPPLTQ